MKSTGSPARAAVLGLWVVLSASAAHAQQQFLLLDTSYTATAQNTSDSHFAATPRDGIPGNWKSPTDYTQGKAYVELDIQQKPSAVSTLYNICFENDSGAACLPYGPAYTMTGHTAWSADFPSFWNFDVVDWTKGVTKVSLILKDAMENKKQGDADFYPYQAHVVISIVPKGMSYVAPMGTGGTAGAGAGAGSGAGASGRAGMSGGAGRRAAAGSGGVSAVSGTGGGGNSAGGGGRAPHAGTGGARDAGVQDAGSAGSTATSAGTTSSAANGGSGGKSSSSASAGTASNVIGQAGRTSAAAQLEDSSGCSVARVRGGGSALAFAAISLVVAGAARRKRRR
jgi:hypothetical protein